MLKVAAKCGIEHFTPKTELKNWRTLSKIPSVVFIMSSATTILACRSSELTTVYSHTNAFVFRYK